MKRPYRLGLTGSIGAGKSTVAAMFRDLGLPVWDADHEVHTLYAKGGAGVPEVARLCPTAVQGGAVDRSRLRAWVNADPARVSSLEKAVHPLLRESRALFAADAGAKGAVMVVFDIPLLYEAKLEADVDAVLVVTAPDDIRRARVMTRQGMTDALYDGLSRRQMPQAEKTRRADFVIPSVDLAATEAAVRALVQRIRGKADA